MINTEQNVNIKQPLKMIDFNPQTFVKDNLVIMTNYIIELEQTKYIPVDELPDNLFLSLDEKGKLIAGHNKEYQKPVYGYKSYIDKRLRTRHKNETDSAWAKRILNNYCKWLIPYYQTQANASVPECISTKRFCQMQLFTNDSYVNWIMQRLDELDDGMDIDTTILHRDADYALRSFITTISQFKTIKHDLLKDIINDVGIIASVDEEMHADIKSPMLWKTFLKILIDILNGEDGVPQIIYHRINLRIDFLGLIKRCQQVGFSITRLPLEALSSYGEAYHANQRLITIPITIRDTNDIEYSELTFKDEIILPYLDAAHDHLTINLNGFRSEIEALLAHPDNYGNNHYYLHDSLSLILQKVLQYY